ncbi:hypothetical protein N7456_010256 [Penicillium angulare]|uniref:Uncharacterized protein n=1 Tax=Penicillium angulare TaxID=116970 RepID=A0A9W9K6B2_9EURO|nr:hypothetical protein N7456_010256 [Penicillium angulare]
MSDATLLTLSRASAHRMAFAPSPKSASSCTSIFSGDLDVDTEGFLQSRFRAGGPVLCSLPGFIGRLGAEILSHDDEIHDITADILHKYNIHYIQLHLTGRIPIIRTENQPIPTVFVLIRHQSPPKSSQWRQIARIIHKRLASQFPEISVELMDENLAIKTNCSPVPHGHSVVPKWRQICDSILNTLNISEWTGIALWRYGVEYNASDDRITLIVSVLESATGPFNNSARRIRSILTAANERDIDVLFLKSERWRALDSPERKLEYKVPTEICIDRVVHPATSIGIKDSDAGTSTLGGIVELKKDSNWYPYALTCFHCVYPPREHRQKLSAIKGAFSVSKIANNDSEGTAFASWESNEIVPDDKMAKKLLRVEQPSSLDLRNSIAIANSQIESYGDKKFRQLDILAKRIEQGSGELMTPREKRTYQQILKFNASNQKQKDIYKKMLTDKSHQLDHVFAGSGLYALTSGPSGAKRVSDWALIEINPKLLPDKDSGSLEMINKPFKYERNAGIRSIPFSLPAKGFKMISGTPLFKTGRSSGKKSCTYNELREVHIHRQKDMTAPEGFRMVASWEHSLTCSYSEIFAEPGDFGSFVYNDKGSVVGMLTSNDQRLRTWSFSLLSNIFADIKAVTGAQDVRLPVE